MKETRKQKIDRQRGHAADRVLNPIRAAIDAGDLQIGPLPRRPDVLHEPSEAEYAALLKMFEAYQALKDLGWREAIYCPKDGSRFWSIEVGSTGIHDTAYEGDWPKGSWWIYDGDLWPARPCLFKLKADPPVVRREG